MTDENEGLCVYNGHYEVVVRIDRPVEEVWRHYIDIGSWVTSHRVEIIAGSNDGVGSITRLSFLKAEQLGMPRPHYHYCKIIELIEEERYILKSYTEKDGSYGFRGIAFDDTRFIGHGRATSIVFNLFAQIAFDSDACGLQSMNLTASKEGMIDNLGNLKRMVESSH